MEIILRVDGLSEEQFISADNNEPITITGELIAIEFSNGVYEKLKEKAEKFDELQELETEDGTN